MAHQAKPRDSLRGSCWCLSCCSCSCSVSTHALICHHRCHHCVVPALLYNAAVHRHNHCMWLPASELPRLTRLSLSHVLHLLMHCLGSLHLSEFTHAWTRTPVQIVAFSVAFMHHRVSCRTNRGLVSCMNCSSSAGRLCIYGHCCCFERNTCHQISGWSLLHYADYADAG